MKNMNFTPADVVAAYQKTGLKPVFGTWGDGIHCGCALTVYCAAQGVRLEGIQEIDVYDIVDFFAEKLDVSSRQIEAFVRGYDQNQPTSAEQRPGLSQAYVLGKQCHSVVREAYQESFINPTIHR